MSSFDPAKHDPLVADLVEHAEGYVTAGETSTMDDMDAEADMRDETADALSAVVAAARAVAALDPDGWDVSARTEAARALRDALSAADAVIAGDEGEP